MTTVSAENENDLAAPAQMRPDIVMRAEEAQVEAAAELVAGLRQMVNNPDYSDVVFLCNDEKQVRASRIHLAARSDVLRSLLMNGVAESNLAEIKLSEVSSPVMLSVLEFLYTGTLLDYPPQNWKMGWDVIIASRFFLLPKLEIIVRKFMRVQISSVAKDLPAVATLLTETMGFKVFGKLTDPILRELVTILSSNWSDLVFVQNLSEDAFHYLLASASCNLEDDDIFSFREYLRFRQVIQWWVYHSNLGSFSRDFLMSVLVPDRAGVLSICGPENLEETVEETTESTDEHLVRDWDTLLSDEEPKMAAIRLLSNIDYRLIHPIVLAEVVEPLKISSGEILSAFRFHALRRTRFFKICEYRWYEGQSYSTFEHGHVVYRTGETTGVAVMKEKFHFRSQVVYEWELVLEEDCSLFAELGLLASIPGFPLQLDKKLSDHDWAYVLKFNGKETQVSHQHASRGTWEVLQVKPFFTGSRVSFIVDASKHNCALSINGKDFGVVWKFNPARAFYPAVSFGNCRQGRIRIELVRGFDILRRTNANKRPFIS